MPIGMAAGPPKPPPCLDQVKGQIRRCQIRFDANEPMGMIQRLCRNNRRSVRLQPCCKVHRVEGWYARLLYLEVMGQNEAGHADAVCYNDPRRPPMELDNTSTR